MTLVRYIRYRSLTLIHDHRMHQTLRISEVLSHIFDYALLTPEDGRLSALRSLALTCRAFSDPALAILWRSASSLVPLVKCLPADFWEIRGTDDGENTLVCCSSHDYYWCS
ncbi:hypothetical protein FIBSPDRAFT_862903 [Athelia psychrophila]|uniref:F-box domain-containing protein n=1 Tax=Athelia psychrophila TaxID=1759441 RepID=A0A166HV18_9AGAM|nr:hypothetical protein FIBSPDRAFT_862903 [Fibularhizoctonia sp. CBS 109695]